MELEERFFALFSPYRPVKLRNDPAWLTTSCLFFGSYREKRLRQIPPLKPRQENRPTPPRGRTNTSYGSSPRASITDDIACFFGAGAGTTCRNYNHGLPKTDHLPGALFVSGNPRSREVTSLGRAKDNCGQRRPPSRPCRGTTATSIAAAAPPGPLIGRRPAQLPHRANPGESYYIRIRAGSDAN